MSAPNPLLPNPPPVAVPHSTRGTEKLISTSKSLDFSVRRRCLFSYSNLMFRIALKRNPRGKICSGVLPWVLCFPSGFLAKIIMLRYRSHHHPAYQKLMENLFRSNMLVTTYNGSYTSSPSSMTRNLWSKTMNIAA